ncbi:MAG: hypothetical protein WCV62_04210 [Candidatus Peribacteraceae bacterium]|jgi:hypothetical protein
MSGNSEQFTHDKEEFLTFIQFAYEQEQHDKCAATIQERINNGTVQTLEQLHALLDDLLAEIFKQENQGIDNMYIGGDDCCDFDLVH